jgi:hypothetical protein
MLTAEEAKNMTEKKRLEESVRIEGLVKMAINNGEGLIAVDTLRDKTIKTLEEHHYNVVPVNKNNEAYYRISWE